MTRKHYERIAAVIAIRVNRASAMDPNRVDVGARISEIYSVANALANTFREDNARFDRETFMKACGL